MGRVKGVRKFSKDQYFKCTRPGCHGVARRFATQLYKCDVCGETFGATRRPEMAKRGKRKTDEEKIDLIVQHAEEYANHTVAEYCEEISMSKANYSNWKKKFAQEIKARLDGVDNTELTELENLPPQQKDSSPEVGGMGRLAATYFIKLCVMRHLDEAPGSLRELIKEQL